MKQDDKRVRLAYPKDVINLWPDDIIILRSRSKKGERALAPGKWFIDRCTSVGEDAELWERMPYDGMRPFYHRSIIAVERKTK